MNEDVRGDFSSDSSTVSFHSRSVVNPTLDSNDAALIATLIAMLIATLIGYFSRMDIFLVSFQVLRTINPAFNLTWEPCQQYKTLKMLSECHPH
jgi:ABC-type phosphate/phosphonate transport system permease subunit